MSFPLNVYFSLVIIVSIFDCHFWISERWTACRKEGRILGQMKTSQESSLKKLTEASYLTNHKALGGGLFMNQ